MRADTSAASLRTRLLAGLVIPAHPLALRSDRRFDERRQRALTRYYLAAGAGGLAMGVHTTQFEIRDPRHGLLEPVLAVAADEASRAAERPVLVAGACGPTPQAVREAEMAASLGYDCVLLSLAALSDASDAELVRHCRAVGQVIPLFGFYLQVAVGGRPLGLSFWRSFLALPEVVAVKVAPFDRYRTLDVVRALAEVDRRDEVALYTGNDDHIILDLLMPWPDGHPGYAFAGGLLGQWAVGARAAAEAFHRVRAWRSSGCVPREALVLAEQVTETNAALFDAANGFRGCIPGIHDVLHRQGLLAGNWCLDPSACLSLGQSEEIERVRAAYPHLHDDDFVRDNLEQWLT